jgi:hypothetical protein
VTKLTDWDEYDAWNSAIATILYSSEMAGVHAYMDLDDDIMRQISELAVGSSDDPETGLLDAVRSTLGVTGELRQMFRPHRNRLAKWKSELAHSTQPPEPPPILALLAVTVLAAEAMGRGEVAANAYFVHLVLRLGISTDKGRRVVEQSYREDAETMWDAVDVWLTKLNGERGLPTAFAISHRFVGLPLSQALVRAADRDRLPKFFDSFGLPAGYSMPAADMAGLVDQWVIQQPCPVGANFLRLWQRPAARERMAEVVALELSNWDGIIHDSGAAYEVPTRGRLRALGMLVNRLGKLRLELTLALRASGSGASAVGVLNPDGSVVTLNFQPSSGGYLLLDYNQSINMGVVLSGVLQGTDENGLIADRRPRRILPLSYNDTQAAFVETERVQLAQGALVLVQDHGNWPDEVEAYLNTVARPGFVRQPPTLEGVPAGWVLFTEVAVLFRGQGPAAKKFTELVPLGSAQLSAAGGLKLPGRIQKWSSLQPPEVHAISQNANSIRVRITSRLPETDNQFWTQEFSSEDSPALVVNLIDLELLDGDYRIALFEDDEKTPIQQMELRLRSSMTGDAWTWMSAKRIWHDFDRSGPIGALTAIRADDTSSSHFVDGPFSYCASSASRQESTISFDAWWIEQRPQTMRPTMPVHVMVPDAKSCIVTGAHFLDLPSAERGSGAAAYLDGVCRYCGLVKRQPAWKPKLRATRSLMEKTTEFDVSKIEPVANRDSVVTWKAAIDGVMHVGGGSYGWLERLALQIEGSQLFAHHFLKTLEGLGVIDVLRDEYLNPIEWELVPRYLPQLDDGSFALIGHWPSDIVLRFIADVEAAGGQHQRRQSHDGPGIDSVSGLGEQEVIKLAQVVEATVVPASSSRLLGVLPTLKELMDSLPRIAVPGAKTVEAFHVPSARWVSATDISGIGAFRINNGFGLMTIFRTEKDFLEGKAAITPAYLAKHLAALQFGRPLLAYLPEARKLLVPIGADLPGLYERALVLSSGQMPEKLQGTGKTHLKFTSYSNVSVNDAQTLWSLLTH